MNREISVPYHIRVQIPAENNIWAKWQTLDMRYESYGKKKVGNH